MSRGGRPPRRFEWPWKSREQIASDVDEEIAFHLDMRAEDLVREGVDPARAREQAEREFGDVEHLRARLRSADESGERRRRRSEWLRDLRQDVRFASRSLRTSPGFAAVALLTLALGIGANAAMFSVVDGVLLRPLPYAEPDELVRVYQASPEQGLFRGMISPVDFDDWRERTRSFAGMAAYAHLHQILTGRGDPVEIRTAFVTEDFFRVLGTPVRLGRPLQAEDARDAKRSAVVSDRLWRTRLGADPGAVGRSIVLQGQPYTVVGVMPPDFRFPSSGTDVWAPHSVLTPMQFGPRERGNRNLEGVARLAEGASPERAESELGRLAARLAAEYPESNAGWDAATVVPLRTTIVGDVDTALLVVLGVVGFILLIGCANLANLLLARGSTRAREIALRAALGAGRGRLVRQLLAESLLLALLGGLLGLVLSIWGVRAVVALSADTLPRIEDVRVDARVLGFGLLLAIATGLLFGLLPALRSARTDPQQSLRGGRGAVGTAGQPLRNMLVVAEVTLAVVLVIGAGLMARSFLELRRVDPGFEPERVLTVSLQLNIGGRPVQEVPGYLVQTREALIERVRALPGVAEVGMINAFPLQDEGGPLFEFRRADGSGTPDGSPLRAHVRYVNPDYIRTMGIPLLRGEPLPEEWAPGAPVPMLVGETAARRFWPGQDPLGQRVDVRWAEAVVAGVVGDVREAGLGEEPAPVIYFPQRIAPRSLATLVVRASGDPLALARPVRQAIHEVDPHLAIRSVSTLGGVVAESIAQERFFTILFGVFGALALVLATLAIYGVLAYTVSQRTREIGVRMALGARAADVLRLVVGSGLLLVGAGFALGTVAALALTRLLESQLYGVRPTDPATYAAVAAVLAAVALLASYIPARRATRVDPVVTLRAE